MAAQGSSRMEEQAQGHHLSQYIGLDTTLSGATKGFLQLFLDSRQEYSQRPVGLVHGRNPDFS